MAASILDWLRATCAKYELEPIAVYRAAGDHPWPLVAKDESELRQVLRKGGHFLPLPKEPAALANVLEVALVEFLMRRLQEIAGVTAQRGTERGYPDLEVSGGLFGENYHAIDVKVARRRVGKSGKVGANTESRITLYTGNTYFRYPQLKWPGTFRPFQDYQNHFDIIILYTLNESLDSRVEDLEIIVQESWQIASRQRSSTTREYIGAIVRIADLRHGRGEFLSPEEFYKFWRKYNFKIGKVVQQQLDRLLREQATAKK